MTSLRWTKIWLRPLEFQFSAVNTQPQLDQWEITDNVLTETSVGKYEVTAEIIFPFWFPSFVNKGGNFISRKPQLNPRGLNLYKCENGKKDKEKTLHHAWTNWASTTFS